MRRALRWTGIAVAPEFTSPDLRVVSAYDPEAFTRLLRAGIALGGRQLGVMSEEARNNLAQLTDPEISALQLPAQFTRSDSLTYTRSS